MSKTDNLSSLYNINLSGTSGIEDYTYDEIFIGRYEDPSGKNFLSRQFIPNEGAFTTYTPHSSTNEWLTALNISSAIPYLPVKIPLKVYANAAVFGDTQAVAGHTDLDNYAWEAGIKFSIAGDNIQVFLPMIMSKDLKNISEDLHSNYFENIRFSINLNCFNPPELIEKQLSL